jgi:hypothetical protein
MVGDESMNFDKIGNGRCSLCGDNFIGRCPHRVPSYPSLKALEPSFIPLREAHCCKTCKRCAINDEGTYGFCAEIMRGVSTGDEYKKAVLEVELDFFCRYWEARE